MTSIKSYYKYWGEDMYGVEGLTYIEFTDNQCARQISFHGDRKLYFAYPRDTREMCDVPLYDMGLTDDEIITQEEFEIIWKKQLLD